MMHKGKNVTIAVANMLKKRGLDHAQAIFILCELVGSIVAELAEDKPELEEGIDLCTSLIRDATQDETDGSVTRH